MAKRPGMAYQIVYTQKARQTIAAVVDYVESQWSEKVASEFIFKLNRYINMLALGTLDGRVTAKKKDIKTILITKHNRLYYRIKKDIIQIILLWDTRQNPARNPYN